MINQLIEILHSGNHSLVIEKDKILTFDGRGVGDLFRLYTTAPDFLTGAVVADKVVGKGAAAIMLLGGVSQLYADVISKPALELLKTGNITVSFGKLVENIINREGTGVCPVEALCLDCATPEECFPRIEKFIKSIS